MKNYCEYFGLRDGRIVCFKKGIGRSFALASAISGGRMVALVGGGVGRHGQHAASRHSSKPPDCSAAASAAQWFNFHISADHRRQLKGDGCCIAGIQRI